MKLRFTKMHGLGNDFVVIDAIRQSVELSPEQVRLLAHRRFGVGCDQVLLAAAATEPGSDFRYRIYNSDGDEVEHCGNGVRCLAMFLIDQALTDKRDLVIQTNGTPARTQLQDNGEVMVDMGPPRLEPATIPFTAPTRAASYSLQIADETLRIAAVSMGNPHAVLRVDNVDTAPLERLGPLLETHTRFPRRVNAGFMQVLSPQHIRLRVFERGVGETLACGTGACAAVVAGQLQGWLSGQVAVDLPGGRLQIHWPGEGESVWMTGPAHTVFTGEVHLPMHAIKPLSSHA